MSSLISKTEKRVQLQNENKWLRTAFRKALSGLMEQNKNVVELSTALAVTLAKTGGSSQVTPDDLKNTDPNTRIRAEKDTETGIVTYSLYIDEPQPIKDKAALAEAVAQALPGFVEALSPSDDEDGAGE